MKRAIAGSTSIQADEIDEAVERIVSTVGRVCTEESVVDLGCKPRRREDPSGREHGLGVVEDPQDERRVIDQMDWP